MRNYLKITDLNRDKFMAVILIMECLIVLYLLAKAFTGAPSELAFSGAAFFDIVSEINNFAYYKASGGCARILQGNMPLSAAKIRRSKRQNEKSFVVYYKSNKSTE